MNRALLRWFEAHGRDLAFRRTRDPYAILVSEVMLQQTQAARVEPAWAAFVDRFPTVAALAAASPAEVIRAWGGLGYNGRAVRLRAAAEALLQRHKGRIRDDVSALEGLPGVGQYTARAVAAIAFGRAVAAVDTNIGRVIGRVHGLGDSRGGGESLPPASSSAGSRAHIQALADGMVHPSRPADWTHAMMDVGASLCRRRDPLCAECPLRPFCRSAGQWDRAGRPTKVAPSPTTTGAPPTGRARATVPFPATRRWLRGRIVAHLRTVPDGRWARFDGAIGEHSRAAVELALGQLAADGLVERDRLGRARLPRARLPQARLPRASSCGPRA